MYMYQQLDTFINLKTHETRNATLTLKTIFSNKHASFCKADEKGGVRPTVFFFKRTGKGGGTQRLGAENQYLYCPF